MSTEETFRKRLTDAESFFDAGDVAMKVARERFDTCVHQLRRMNQAGVVDSALLRNPRYILRKSSDVAQAGAEIVMRREIIHQAVQQPIPDSIDTAEFLDGLCLELERLAAELAAISIRYTQLVDGLEAQLAEIAKRHGDAH